MQCIARSQCQLAFSGFINTIGYRDDKLAGRNNDLMIVWNIRTLLLQALVYFFLGSV